MGTEKNMAKAISEKYHIHEHWIICGAESEDLIHRFVYGIKPEKAVIMQPTGFAYEAELRCIGAGMIDYPLIRDHFKLKHDLLALVEDGVDAVFLCNPNDPTGILADKALILEVLEKARKRNIYVVVDEHMLSLTGRERYASLIGDVSAYDNLVVIKSVLNPEDAAQTYASYSVCRNEAVLAKMRAVQGYGKMDEARAVAALEDDEAVVRAMRYYNEERRYLESEFTRIGIRYFQSYVNYMMVYCPEKPDFAAICAEAGIMAEACSAYKNLDKDYYKVMIGSRAANERLIKLLVHQ